MELDEEIDNSIIDMLNKNKKMYYMGLYRAICKAYKKISIDAFNFHLKTMRDKNLIDRQDSKERGKKVYYFLSEKAKQEQRLKILQFKSQKGKINLKRESDEGRRQKLYFLMLLFLQNWKPVYSVKDGEDGLNDIILADANITKKDLIVKEIKKEVQGDQHIVSTIYKPISGLAIRKQEIFKEPNKQNYRVGYNCVLPGVSIDEILKDSNRIAFKHNKFRRTEVEDALDLARKEGLLKLIIFGDDFRYVVADDALENLLRECWGLYSAILYKMERKWKFICSPTKEECKWLELFHGAKRADKIRIDAYHHRHSLSSKKKKKYLRKVKEELKILEQDIIEYTEELRRQYDKTIEKYRFPIEKILEVIYPRSIQPSS
jgi:DNA-binding HxlR family transcriptional regulator